MKKRLLVLAFCFAAVWAGALETPWSAWRNAYSEFEKAEQARDAGNYLAAAQGFKKALECYESVRRQRPDWNQSVIVRRIADCKRELGKVEGFLTPVSAAPAPGKKMPTAPVVTPASTAVTPARAVSGEVAALRKKIAELELELQSLRQKEKSRRDLEAEIALLIRDQHLARERQTVLEEKLRQAQSTAGGNAEAQKELQAQLLQSKMECESLRGKLSDMEAKLKQSQAETERVLGQRKFAESAIQATQEKLLRQERETADIRRAEEENRGVREKLAQQLEEAKKNCEQTASELAEARKLLTFTQEKLRLAAADQAGGKVLAEENRTLAGKLSALQLRYDQLDAAFRDLRQQRSSDQAQTQQMKTLAERSESARRMAEKQQLSQEKQLKELRAETISQMKEIAALKAHVATLENDLKTAVAQKDVLTERLRQRDADDYRGAADVAAKQKEWEKTQGKLQETIASQKGEIARLERSIAEKDAQMALSVKSRDQLTAEKSALAQELEQLREAQTHFAQVQSNFSAAQRELQSVRAHLAEAQKEHQELLALRVKQKELDRIKAQLSEKERLAAELGDANAALTAKLAEALKMKDEVIRLRAEAAQVTELRGAIERLKKLNQALAKYRDLEKDLAAANQTIITLQSLSPKLDAALKKQAADQRELDALRQELATQKAQMTAKLEADRRAQQERSDALRRELVKLQAEKRAEAETNGQQASASAAALTELRSQLASAQEALSQRQAQLDEAQKLLRERGEKLLALQAQIADLKKLAEVVTALSAKEKVLAEEVVKLRALNEKLIQEHTSGKEVELLKNQLAEAETFRLEVARLHALNAELRRENRELEFAVLRPQDNALKFDAMPPVAEAPEVLIASGMRAEKENRISSAIWNYENVLKKVPDHAFAAKRLGILLLRREQFERAAAVLKVASRLAPQDPEIAIAAARAANANQNYGSALFYLEPLLKDARPGMDALIAAADAYAGSGKRAKAEELLQLATRSYRQEFAPLIALAKLMAQDPTREEEALRLYEHLRVVGAPPEPKLEIRFAGRLDERRELANFLASAAEEAAGRSDWETAIWYRRKATELKRDEGAESAQLAFARYMNGETAAALEELSLHPTTIEGELVAALCHLRDGDQPAFQAALAHAKKLNRDQVIDLAPQWRQLLLELKKRALQTNAKAIGQIIR